MSVVFQKSGFKNDLALVYIQLLLLLSSHFQGVSRVVTFRYLKYPKFGHVTNVSVLSGKYFPVYIIYHQL